MRAAARSLVLCVLMSVALVAQDKPKQEDPNRATVEVTGCAKGSTFIESNVRMPSSDGDSQPQRRWRLRAPKALMKQLKEHQGKELAIVGSTRNPGSGMGAGGRRIGKTNIYIGGDPHGRTRDPLPELPTIEVESFTATGESCR